MKRTFLMLGLIICTFCAKADQYDQRYFDDATLVQLEKAGTLSKALGKNTESITSLQIKGDMSDKDMKILGKLTNLKKLSLRYANIETTKYFPTFPNLEVLFLPENQHLPIEFMSMVPANQNLKVMLFCSFLDRQLEGKYVRFTPFKSLKKVIITNMLPEQTMDYKNYGVATGDRIASGKNDFLLVDTIVYLFDHEQYTKEGPKYYSVKNEKQQFRGNYEEQNGYVFYVGNENVDFSTIQAVRKPEVLSRWENNSDGGKINREYIMRPDVPASLDLKMMQYIGAGYFNDTKVEQVVFSSSSLKFQEQAFKGAEQLKTITFSNSLSNLTIPQQCFSDCSNLETIIFDCPVTIEQLAFSFDNNIKEIIFNAQATIKSKAFLVQTSYRNKPNIPKIIFNAPVKIESKGLMYVDTIVFNEVPNFLAGDFSLCQNIIVPQNTSDRFTSWGIKGEYVIDPSASLVLEIAVDEPGNILNHLPINKLTQIKSLTVTGHLNETDIAIIKMCTNLKYLNLSNTTISESPEGSQRRKNAAIIGDFEYPNMPECYIPGAAFTNMGLTEVVLPRTVKLIGYSAFSGCASLQKVDFGDSLMIIERYAFANTSLSEVQFPKSLQIIKGEAFDKVVTLRVMDLSKCTMEHFSNWLGGAEVNSKIGCLPNLEILYMPQGMETFNPFVRTDCSGLKDVYVGPDVKVMNYSLDNVTLHFQSEMAPEINSFGFFEKITNCTIYVPKDGNITSYYAKFNGNGNKIIQE